MEEIVRDAAPVASPYADLAEMTSTNSDFVDFITPLQEKITLYDRTSPPSHQAKNDTTDPAKSIPQGFIDAMSVREEVFVKEQHVPLENELDFDDRRCFTWTAYASVPGYVQPVPVGGGHPNRRHSTSTKMPVGTIRLIPPPNTTAHPFAKHRKMDGTPYTGPLQSSVHDGREPFATIGRLAILKEFRKLGISKLLIHSATSMAHTYPYVISAPPPDALRKELRDAVGEALDMSTDWDGLLLVHAQVGLQRFWAGYGFATDEKMGVWDEEGMDHVAMWRRIDLKRPASTHGPYSYVEEPKKFRGSVSG